MDRKAIIVLTISFILLVLWFPLINRIYPPAPRDAAEILDAASAATNLVSHGTNAASAARTPAAVAEAVVPVAKDEPSTPEQTLAIENDKARYVFTSRGGGLKYIDLKNYPAIVVAHGDKDAGQTNLARLNARAVIPVLGIVAPWAGKDAGYTLEKISPTVLRARKHIDGGLLITKEFSLADDYLVHSTLTFSNTTDTTLALAAHELVVGTSSPAGPKDDPSMMGLFIYDGSKKIKEAAAWFDNRSFGCGPANPRDLYETGERPIVWAAVQNQSFALAAIPKVPARELVSRRVELETADAAYIAVHGKASQTAYGFQNGLPYHGSVIDAHAALTREFDLYAGPKELQTLTRLGAQLKNNLDLLMDLDGFFGFFSKLLLFTMNTFHGFGLPYGWAIVGITVGIKLLFWPLTKASTKSMKRMQALQPQMNALKERYKDDPTKMNQKMMEMWKEHKINPLGGCLPMVIQMPVFFGFFYMIRTAIELRGADFLWIHDLSTPDTVFSLPGLDFPINPMAFLMAITMVTQMRLAPASPGMDPMQAQMMKYMPLMFVVFLYNYSSGLTLYWTVQNSLSIIQTKLTQTDNKPASSAPSSGAAPPKKQKRT